MEQKKYSSFEEIDRELEILKMEKDIHYHRLIYNVQKTKEGLEPMNLIKGLVSSTVSNFPSSLGTIFNIALPFMIKRFFNKKRGH
jgi:hypothetical protein